MPSHRAALVSAFVEICFSSVTVITGTYVGTDILHILLLELQDGVEILLLGHLHINLRLSFLVLQGTVQQEDALSSPTQKVSANLNGTLARESKKSQRHLAFAPVVQTLLLSYDATCHALLELLTYRHVCAQLVSEGELY